MHLGFGPFVRMWNRHFPFTFSPSSTSRRQALPPIECRATPAPSILCRTLDPCRRGAICIDLRDLRSLLRQWPPIPRAQHGALHHPPRFVPTPLSFREGARFKARFLTVSASVSEKDGASV